jgi:hypothetical protein
LLITLMSGTNKISYPQEHLITGKPLLLTIFFLDPQAGNFLNPFPFQTISMQSSF